jgi:hypothetical protein
MYYVELENIETKQGESLGAMKSKTTTTKQQQQHHQNQTRKNPITPQNTLKRQKRNNNNNTTQNLLKVQHRYCSLICSRGKNGKYNISHATKLGVRGRVVKVVDFKSPAPFESSQGLNSLM